MRRFLEYIRIIMVLALCGCHEIDMDNLVTTGGEGLSSVEITGACSMDVPAMGGGQGFMTKALITQTSTASFINGNFIKVDELPPSGESWTREDQYDNTKTRQVGFENSQIVNAQVFSSPDNTTAHSLRSVVFNPRLVYSYAPINESVADPELAYVSKMVGWYPQTYNVPKGFGDENAIAQFSSAGCMKVVNGKVCVEFKNKLDGQTDLMMTDMREGRMYKKGFKHTPGPDKDIQPFGHMFDDPLNPSSLIYQNYFTFHHYLSCIRVSLVVEGGVLDEISWRQINNIKIKNQPTTATISLPTEQARSTTSAGHISGTTATLPSEGVLPVFGEVMEWSDFKDMDIIRTPMFENDSPEPGWGQSSELPYVLPRTGNVPHEGVYVGYALVRPDVDTELQLFTDAGTYSVKIPARVKVNDEDVDVLKEGYVYDVKVNVNSVGVMDVVVENDNTDKFKDITPYNDEYGDYEYSNCYVITPSMMKLTDTKDYDGFFFRPNVPGRGPKGDIEGDDYAADFEFEPSHVKLLSQSPEPYATGMQGMLPLEHVELVQGYVRFTLNMNSSSTDLVEGNAIIALCDKEDKIIWSWHIWVSDDEISDIELNGTAFMDRNLGASFAPDDASAVQTTNVLSTYGLYYQWGRKDPSSGPREYNYSIYDMRTAQYCSVDGVRDDVAEVYMTGSAPSISDGVAHPLVILAPSTPYYDPDQAIVYSEDWLYMKNDDLWGSVSGKKTIYDPCPYGYKVPYTELRDMFNNYKDSFTKGSVGMFYNVTGTNGGFLYFPYAGCKGDDVNRTSRTHAWFWCGRVGDYMDAEIHDNGYRGRSMLSKDVSQVKLTGDTKNQYNLGFNDYTTKSDTSEKIYGTKRGVAASVRCIRYASEP